jgi:hypothetical protein
MRYTISQLFDAIHYCNQLVKTDYFIDDVFKKDFYNKKRMLVYHMIKNHKVMKITIDECCIDKQDSKICDGINELYSFCLKHNGNELRVHQKKNIKLDTLFALNNIVFSEGEKYQHRPDVNLVFTEDAINSAIKVIDKFYKKWNLQHIITNLGDRFVPYKTTYESFVYYYPDFIFSLEFPEDKIEKRSIVKIKHKKSKRAYRMEMVALRKCGDNYLPLWRDKAVKCKNTL